MTRPLPLVLALVLMTGCASSGPTTRPSFDVWVSQNAVTIQDASALGTAVYLDSVSPAERPAALATLRNIATAVESMTLPGPLDLSVLQPGIDKLIADSGLKQQALLRTLSRRLLARVEKSQPVLSTVGQEHVEAVKALLGAVAAGILDATRE